MKIKSYRMQLFAGVAMTDITPLPGTALGIDFVVHYARVIRNPLYAKVLTNQAPIISFSISNKYKSITDVLSGNIFLDTLLIKKSIAL